MNYVENTKEALCDVAVVTNQLMQFFDFSTDGSVLGISRLSAYLHLLHHQVSVYSCFGVVGTYSLAVVYYSYYPPTPLHLSRSSIALPRAWTTPICKCKNSTENVS